MHALASWFETTGLVSLEAAYLGCNIVITNRGDQLDYFGDNAFYCDPESVSSIKEAVDAAYVSASSDILRQKILTEYNWEVTAQRTIHAYKEIFKN